MKKEKGQEEESVSFEERFARLEELVKQMEDPETSLNDAFDSYKEGMSLVQSLNGMIDGIEKQVKELSEDGEE
ncbi:MAG: exodeoxyribonuclease VII small subunit [Lachnospiraceae bacterium]|nr:exodeoxyribonuclease VII small subunit [Lachnospiraceae bacterium]